MTVSPVRTASPSFAQHARVQIETSNRPEMTDAQRAHLLAQSRHIERRITAKTGVAEIRAMCEQRSMILKFAEVLFDSVVLEWLYMRRESGMANDEAGAPIDLLEEVFQASYTERVNSYNA